MRPEEAVPGPADPWEGDPFGEAMMVFGQLEAMDELDHLREAVAALTEDEAKMLVFTLALRSAERRLAAEEALAAEYMERLREADDARRDALGADDRDGDR